MSALSAVVAFLVNILSARVLGPQLRGEVAVVLQLGYLIGPLVGFGGDRALVRGFERAGNGTSTSERTPGVPHLWMVAGSAVIVGAALYPIYGRYALFAAAVSVVTALLSFNRSLAIRTRKLRSFFLCTGLYQASILAAAVVFALLRVENAVWWTLSYFFPGILLALLAWSFVARSRFYWKRGAAEIVRSNVWMVASSLGTLITTRLVRVLLPLMVSHAALGLFIVVATATEPLFWVGKSLADFTSGRQGAGAGWSLRERNRAVRREVLRGAAVFATLGALGGMVLYFLLVPIFGQQFAPALPLVAPLTAATIILAMQRHMTGLILAGPRPSRTGYVDGLTALISVIVFPVALHLGGLMGAAWGSLAVYAAGLVLAVAWYPWRVEAPAQEQGQRQNQSAPAVDDAAHPRT